jgi:hypothetical protein
MEDPFESVLVKVRDQPGMYIGQKSAESLFMFLHGFTFALNQYTGLKSTWYDDFIDHLYDKFGRGGGGHSWASVLTYKAGSEDTALDLFFEELDRFQSRRAKSDKISK